MILLIALCLGSDRVHAATPRALDQAQVVERIAALLEQRYVYEDRGRKMALELRRDIAKGRGSAPLEPKAFADTVTRRLRALSSDGHLALGYSRQPLSVEGDPGERDHVRQEMERWYGAAVNHGFESIRRLEGGVGYLDLRVFAPTSMASDMAQAAMTLLAQSSALIIDLRKNGGGHDDMVALLSGYLFDESRPLSGKYDRPSNRLTPLATPKEVPGRRYGGKKPVYILISRQTFSAAEAFAYDLQALQRATIVGETSGGGAHPFEYRRIDRDFVLSLPEGRSINPITGGDWEGRGVVPDVPSSPSRALDLALRLAKARVAQETNGKR